MKEVIAILQSAEAHLGRLADELEEFDLDIEEMNAFREVKGKLNQALAILETAAAQGMF